MIANVAFLAALTVFLVAAWLAGELTFLAPYKGFLFRRHGDVIAFGALLLFLNLCAIYYSLARCGVGDRCASACGPHRAGTAIGR